MVNRFFRRTPYEGSLYAPNVEFLAQQMDYAQKQYDAHKKLAEDIQDFTIPSLPQDREEAIRLQKEYADQVDAVVKQYSGDYSKAGQALDDLQRKIKRDFNPGGKAEAITSNYNNYVTWLKDSKEQIKSGKVLGEDFNLAHKYYMDRYQGIGKFDPTTGTFNKFNPDSLTEYADSESILKKAFDTVKPEKKKIGTTVFRNGEQIYQEQEVEGVSAERLKSAYDAALGSDPKFTAYLKQKSQFLGLSPEEAQKYYSNYTTSRAADMAYSSSSNITKAERDPLYLLHERYRLAKKMKDEPQPANPYEYDPATGGILAKPSNITPQTWRGVGSQINAESASSFSSFGTGSLYFLPLDASDPSGIKYNNFQEAIKDPVYLKQTNLNGTLANTLFEWNKNKVDQELRKSGRTFSTMYGVDPKWTDEFDKQVVKSIKNNEPRLSMIQPESLALQSADQREEASKLAYTRLTQDASVTEVGTNYAMSSKTAGIDPEAFLDENGKVKPFVSNYAPPGFGYSSAGMLFDYKGKRYILNEPNAMIKRTADELAAATNDIFFNGKTESDHYVQNGLDEKGQPTYAALKLNYSVGPDGLINTNLYKIPIKKKLDFATQRFEMVKDYEKAYPTNLEDIQKPYKEIFDGAIGRGASKADQTPFFFFTEN